MPNLCIRTSSVLEILYDVTYLSIIDVIFLFYNLLRWSMSVIQHSNVALPEISAVSQGYDRLVSELLAITG